MPKSIQYKEGYKYQLHADYNDTIAVRPPADIPTEYITLTTTGKIKIKKGYAWDGASGAPDTKTIMRASLVHDALYQLMRHDELDRKLWRNTADKELKRMCLEDGMTKAKAEVVYFTVCKLGANAAKKENKKKVITAPKQSKI